MGDYNMSLVHARWKEYTYGKFAGRGILLIKRDRLEIRRCIVDRCQTYGMRVPRCSLKIVTQLSVCRGGSWYNTLCVVHKKS